MVACRLVLVWWMAGEHERAGGCSGGAKGDKPQVGLMQAEGQPAGEFARDEQPGSG
jgi:hypothetical protein